MDIFQSDSTTVSKQLPAEEEELQGAPVIENVHSEPRHPYQVLQHLPKDATPAQQDSAIQAVFDVQNTHLSTRPDTLHLPGYGKGRSIKDIDIPQYYRETFFSNDSLLHPEVDGGRTGVAGVPMPYTVRTDNTIVALLVACLLLAVIAFSRSRRFIFLQAKHLLHEPGQLTTELTETTGEVRFQVFLVLLTSLLLGIMSFIYVQQNVADTFILPSQYQLIWIMTGFFAAYFALRFLMHWAVNSVFFPKAACQRWLKLLLFATSAEGVAFMPAIMLLAFFSASVHNVIIYVATVIILVKILLFYKCKLAFFRQRGQYVQIILYFCALEIMPLLALWGTMAMTVDYLKINF